MLKGFVEVKVYRLWLAQKRSMNIYNKQIKHWNGQLAKYILFDSHSM